LLCFKLIFIVSEKIRSFSHGWQSYQGLPNVVTLDRYWRGCNTLRAGTREPTTYTTYVFRICLRKMDTLCRVIQKTETIATLSTSVSNPQTPLTYLQSLWSR